MAKKTKDVFNISPLSTIALSAEAAIEEAKSKASATSDQQPTTPPTDVVLSSSAAQVQREAPTTSPSTPKPRRNRGGELPAAPIFTAPVKDQRINRTFTISATNDQRLAQAAARYGTTKSAILEQLFEQWWNMQINK